MRRRELCVDARPFHSCRMRDMTHSCVWHDSCVRVISLIYVWQVHERMPGLSIPIVCVTWLIYMCAMTRSCVWHHSFTCGRFMRGCQAFPFLSYAWHDSFICVTWLVCACDMTPLCVTGPWEDARPFHSCFTCRMRDMIALFVRNNSFMSVTWLLDVHGWSMSEFQAFPFLLYVSYVWRDLFICITRLMCACDMTP